MTTLAPAAPVGVESLSIDERMALARFHANLAFQAVADLRDVFRARMDVDIHALYRAQFLEMQERACSWLQFDEWEQERDG